MDLYKGIKFSSKKKDVLIEYSMIIKYKNLQHNCQLLQLNYLYQLLF